MGSIRDIGLLFDLLDGGSSANYGKGPWCATSEETIMSSLPVPGDGEKCEKWVKSKLELCKQPPTKSKDMTEILEGLRAGSREEGCRMPLMVIVSCELLKLVLREVA